MDRLIDDRLRLTRRDALATVTIASPPMNLFDGRMLDAWREVVDDLSETPPRGLLVRAEGRVVSAGVDVSLFKGLGVSGARRLWSDQIQMITTLERLPCPTVFAAHGLTLTAAFEIALACDLLVATPSATFGLVERVVGITPSMGGGQRLSLRAGESRAKELIMTGDTYNAETLHRWGVVTAVLDEESFADEAEAYARRLAEGPTRAHQATKEIVRSAGEGGVPLADARMPFIASQLFATRDTERAVDAFLEHGPRHGVEFTGE